MTKRSRIVSIILFLIYILLLTWIIIYKMDFMLTRMPDRSLNLVPLQGTAKYHGHYDYKELFFNVIIFIPLGMFVSMAIKRFNLVAAFCCGFMLSIIYEAVQYVLICGVADVTDVITNTAGALIGGIVYLINKAIFKKNHIMVINTVGMIVFIIMLMFGAISLMGFYWF
ncbi:MAG: VanZ family protein [Lachnospiraceae bacterium]|nr:VanZ family protein [Lachnospiraceae bacterium]